MTATYRISNAGNIAIQSEAWDVPIPAARALAAYMKELGVAGPGSYWEANAARPIRRAVRAKADSVRLYTAGFSTGELANWLRNVGCDVERADA